MAALLYLAPGNPLLQALTDDTSITKHIRIDINRPSGDKTVILPQHPTLPEVTVIAVTKSIYDNNEETRTLRAPHSLKTILEYYDYYSLPEASEYALARYLNSEDPQVAAASIIQLAKDHKQVKMSTYLYHMRSAAAYHDCPFLFLATYCNKNQNKAGRVAQLAHHFRQITSIKEAHRPYKTESRAQPEYDTYMIPVDGTAKEASPQAYLEPAVNYFICEHCGTRLRDTYTVRLSHPNKCSAQPRTRFPIRKR